jgi:hypothetical protein
MMNAPKDLDHLDPDKQAHKENIENDEDLHQKQAGNDREDDAEKRKLSGPGIDLVGQPAEDDDE